MSLFNSKVSPKMLVLTMAISFAGNIVSAQDRDAITESNQLLLNVGRYEAMLEDMESEFGPFDARLQEPLSGIENLYIEFGDFERVREIQSRRLQLLRTTLGLESPEAIPLLESMIRTELQLGNWEAVSDHLDHLLTLAQENYGIDSDQAMAAMERQASWYMARVYLDDDRDRAEHFIEARDIYDDLLDIAEDKFGEQDPALIPWLYKRAFSLAQLVALLNSEGSLRGDAIDETLRADGPGRLETATRRGFFPSATPFGPSSRVPIVNGDEPVGAAYLRLASGYIDDIRDIAEAEGDWETWAMATVYYGDYSFLRGRNSGRGDYREAREKLVELGFSEDRLERFFNRPMPIPVPQFYGSFAEIETYQQQLVENLQPILDEERREEAASADPEEPWDQPVHVGRFVAWEDDAPAAPRPLLLDPVFAMNLPTAVVDFSFRLNGNGKVSGVDVLQVQPDGSRARRDAIRGVRALRFRPALYEGRSKTRREVQLRYILLAEE
ncbi:MAG: hypothetical protein RL839_16845 [Gammaproteobacteria bacterium]